MAKIIGIIRTKFQAKDTGNTVEGQTIHVTESIASERGMGEAADHFFLSKAKLAALDFTPAPGQSVHVLYNKFGRVETLKLIDPDDGIVIP